MRNVPSDLSVHALCSGNLDQYYLTQFGLLATAYESYNEGHHIKLPGNLVCIVF
jgi:hypothetical protein